MRRKIIRIFYIIPVSLLITLLAFAYRYIWFNVATIPSGRVFTTVLLLMVISIIFINKAD